MKFTAILANVAAIVFTATCVNAAAITDCVVDKDFSTLKGSEGTNTVKTGSTFCFDLVGKAGTKFPSNSKVSIGFRDTTNYIWTVEEPLCKALTSGPSQANCPHLKANKKGFTGCVKLPKAAVKVPKSGTSLQFSIEFTHDNLAFVCVKGTAKVA
ncbi:hypothetical protein EMPS_05649 [Entomortierella parvispora]|uniref:Uncharacterized protein n=1 Tax=Entomortierella parvispora TaxID=205924 RepID=A0A9P3HB12_9FUNG|nr:hypothetical protein EMPS_05649 [Entomortierella parvispora]